jgi:hypothetical protein
MTLSKTLNKIIVWGLIVAFIVLVITSIIVRDYQYMVQHPLNFSIETVVFSVIPALIIAFIFLKTRGLSVKTSFIWFIVMVLKFAIFHILFQLSGIYTVVFSP